MVSQHLMIKEDVLEEKYYMNNLEKQGVETSKNHDISGITPPHRQKFFDETFETISSK